MATTDNVPQGTAELFHMTSFLFEGQPVQAVIDVCVNQVARYLMGLSPEAREAAIEAFSKDLREIIAHNEADRAKANPL